MTEADKIKNLQKKIKEIEKSLINIYHFIGNLNKNVMEIVDFGISNYIIESKIKKKNNSNRRF